MNQQNTYMDYAAATPVDPSVSRAMQPHQSQFFYNPSSLYLAAKNVKEHLETARGNIAKIIGARPAEVVFTAGGTEANNLAISGIMRRHPDGNLIVSAVEHESVRQTAEQYEHKEAPVDAKGTVDVQKIEKLIDEKTVLVSIMLVNNEIGTIQPIREIAQLVDKVRKARQKNGNKLPIYLHTDACQAGNFLDIHVSRLGVDLMSLNGGKVYGPKQSGVLFVRGGIVLEPIIYGGGQESGLRSGTENTGAQVGFALALAKAQKKRAAETKRLSVLQQLFFDLLAEKIPTSIINGSLKHRIPNNVHVSLPGFDNERLMMELDELGIMCATGSACSASSDEPSNVLKSIGLSDSEAQSSLRFTMGRGTTETDVRRVVDALQKIVAR